MFVTTPSNWDKLRNDPQNIWPLKARFAKNINFEINDQIPIYLSKKAVIAGVIKVRDKLQSTDPFTFSADVYEYKLPVTFDIVLPTKLQIPIREMLEQLEITRGKKNWGCLFQRSMVRLTDNDYNLIRNKINEALTSPVHDNSKG
jgi:hypothetical protein